MVGGYGVGVRPLGGLWERESARWPGGVPGQVSGRGGHRPAGGGSVGALRAPAAAVAGAGESAVADAWRQTRGWPRWTGTDRGAATVAGGTWGTFGLRGLGAGGVASR
jgi:hypothetical protein